jgi:serine/threonine-protein kinase PknG
VIQTEEQLKLIDMGGVRRIDSDEPIYGTVGYQAPEIETDGPSISSDLYTVGRALAVLTFEFRGFQGRFSTSLPDGVPLLEQQESFARLLRRATHSDPGRRFGSAGEMAEQLTGVLREVLATADGTPRPAFSAVFTRADDPPEPALLTGGTHPPRPPLGGTGPPGLLRRPAGVEVVARLPLPLVDRADPAAGYLATFAGLAPDQRVAALTQAVTGQLVVDDVRRQQLTVEILRAALDWCATGQPAGTGPILGCEPNARALRFGLERSYRALARLTPDEDRRIELVDLANAIRPRTLT